jgi:hypothetical protein
MRRALQGGPKCGASRDAVKLGNQSVYLRRGEVRNKRHEVFASAISVGDHGVGNRWIRGKILSGVGEERLQRILAHDRLDKHVRGVREEGFLSARGDQFILVVKKDNENFEAV